METSVSVEVYVDVIDVINQMKASDAKELSNKLATDYLEIEDLVGIAIDASGGNTDEVLSQFDMSDIIQYLNKNGLTVTD